MIAKHVVENINTFPALGRSSLFLNLEFWPLRLGVRIVYLVNFPTTDLMPKYWCFHICNTRDTAVMPCLYEYTAKVKVRGSPRNSVFWNRHQRWKLDGWYPIEGDITPLISIPDTVIASFWINFGMGWKARNLRQVNKLLRDNHRDSINPFLIPYLNRSRRFSSRNIGLPSGC